MLREEIPNSDRYKSLANMRKIVSYLYNNADLYS